MVTPRTELLRRREDMQELFQKYSDMLEKLPEELLDLEVDEFAQYMSGSTQCVSIGQTPLLPGTRAKLLALSTEGEVEARTGWGAGFLCYDFTLLCGIEVVLTTRRPGCRKYAVMDRVQRPRTITVCGELDRSSYLEVKDLGSVGD